MFLPLFVVYMTTATYDAMQSPDPVAAAVPAWQLAVHGNLDVDAHEGMVRWFVEGERHLVSDRMPGIVFFAVPFYWALPTPTDAPSVVPAAVAAVTATAAAMTVLHAALRRLVATSTALVAAVLAGLATSTWSVSADALWPHGIDQLWLSAALLALAAGVWSASGAFFGLAVLTRPQTAVSAAVAGLYAAWTRRSPRPAVLVAAGSLAGVAALVAYHASLFGEPSLLGGYAERPDALLPPSNPLEYAEGVAGTLVSPDRGILVLSPLLLALLPGLPRAWRAAPAWVRAGALSGVAYMLVHLALNRFSGGNNFFSYRLPIEMLTLSAPLLVLAWREWTARTTARRRAFAGLAGLSVLVHALGAVYWVPTFDERSPWTNFKVVEALQTAGVSGLVLALVAVGVTTLAVLSIRPDR